MATLKGDIKSHRKLVSNCYEYFNQSFPICGHENLTEGIYHGDPGIGFDKAQKNQINYLLDQAMCVEGSRILDVGCGYGSLLEEVRRRGAKGIGITISPHQVAFCQGRGLDVRLVDYREIGADWFAKFDAVIANGSMEHFVLPSHAAQGRGDAIYRDFFKLCHDLIDPNSPARRLVTTVIHFGAFTADPNDAMKNPFFKKWFSDPFHYRLLVRTFGGYYPKEGQLSKCGNPLFKVIEEQDGTQDYYYTSEEGLRQIKGAFFSIKLGGKLWWSNLKYLAKRPAHACTAFLCMLIFQSWNWQFRGQEPPMKLLRQTWDYQAIHT